MVMAPCRRPSVSIHVCRAARAHWGWEFLTQARPCCTHRPLTGIPPTPTVTDFGEMKKKIHLSTEIWGAHISVFLTLATSPRENKPSFFSLAHSSRRKGFSAWSPAGRGGCPGGPLPVAHSLLRNMLFVLF